MNDSPAAETTQTSPPSLPVRVRWHGDDGVEEPSRLLHVTPRSATLLLSRSPRLGQLLRLTLPRSTRPAQTGAGDNHLWALVWAIVQQTSDERKRESESAEPSHCVSVVFVGDDVPKEKEVDDGASYAYLAEEDGRFRLQSRRAAQAISSAQQRRRESRIAVPVEVTLEVFGANGQVTMCEQTVTENISRNGAAVWTSLPVAARQWVRLSSEQYEVSITAVVRARRTGFDGITRIHLEFTDGQWPLERVG